MECDLFANGQRECVFDRKRILSNRSQAKYEMIIKKKFIRFCHGMRIACYALVSRMILFPVFFQLNLLFSLNCDDFVSISDWLVYFIVISNRLIFVLLILSSGIALRLEFI